MSEPTQAPTIVLVGDSDDLVIRCTVHELQTQGVAHTLLPPSTLGDISLLLQNNTFIINKVPVAGILFRAYPISIFSQGFRQDEAPFVDAELRAVWLAAFNLPSILSVNRYDAIAWFESLAWPTWRRLMRVRAVPISRFNFGGGQAAEDWIWYPYDASWSRPPMGSAAQRLMGTALTKSQIASSVLVVNGEVVDGTLPDITKAIIPFLSEHGIVFAEITLDKDGHIILLNPMPVIRDEPVAQQIASVLVGQFYAHLRHWRP